MLNPYGAGEFAELNNFYEDDQNQKFSMYQFTHIMTDMQSGIKKTYCWRGLAIGLLGGWLPAWGLSHWQGWGAWAFAGIWMTCLPLGFYLGKLFKKK